MANFLTRGLGGLGRAIVRGIDSAALAGIDGDSLSPEERRAMRSQFLAMLSQGLGQQNPGAGVLMHRAAAQDYMTQRQMQQQLMQRQQAVAAGVEQIMADPTLQGRDRYRKLGDLYSRVGDTDRAAKYYEAADRYDSGAPKAMGPGAPMVQDGKPVLGTTMSDGTVRVLPGVAPRPSLTQIQQGDKTTLVDTDRVAPGTSFPMGLTPGEKRTDERWREDFDYRKQRDTVTDARADRQLALEDWYKRSSISLGREQNAITAQGQRSKAPEALLKGTNTDANLETALHDYGRVLGEVGPRMNPFTDEASRLQTAFVNLQMQLKNLYELGAITGPDMELLNKLMTNPVSPQGYARGLSGLQQQVATMAEIVAKAKANRATAYRQQPQEVEEWERTPHSARRVR